MKEAFERPALNGLKLRVSAKRGGEMSAAIRRGSRPTDIALAREYQNHRPNSALTKTALMTKIGAKYGLKRSSSFEAISRGLKKLSG